jgi:hypothetical protein
MSWETWMTLSIAIVVGGGAPFAFKFVRNRRRSQRQVVGTGGVGIQSGRDTKVRSGSDSKQQ